MLFEIRLLLLLAILCQLAGMAILLFQSPPVDMKPLAIAVLLSLLVSIPPILFRHTRFSQQHQAVMPLATVGWRMNVLLVALGLSAATKWPSHILFCYTLLGCYFPFLVLESALSIRRIRLHSRSQG